METKKKTYFQRIPDISIDYGVMEKTDTLCVVRGNFQWDDVGSWLALERYFKNDKNRNVLIGNAHGLEITDSIMYTYGVPLRAYGLKGVAVVVGPRGVLVCKKSRIQDIKKLFR
jgi:mannose-1-phosphate guanylyltransferase